MKKLWIILLLLCVVCGCAKKEENESEPLNPTNEETAKTEENTPSESTEEKEMYLKIDEKRVEVTWEENASVDALRELCKEEDLVIEMSKYGGFEQVGSIGQELPREDHSTVTEWGDIVLYSGDQIVIFYGSNSWSYTRLGKVKGLSEDDMRALLSEKDVTLTLSVK